MNAQRIKAVYAKIHNLEIDDQAEMTKDIPT